MRASARGERATMKPVIAIAGAVLIALLTAAPAHADDGAAAHAQADALSEMAMGDADAPVTMIEYASLTCSHCADWHQNVFPKVKEAYIDTGKVRLVLREFPVVPAHPALVARSYAGSMLARCAADIGGADAYFSVMGQLFKEQDVWAFGEDARGELLKVAAAAGIDEAAFNHCVTREDLKTHIDQNITTGTDDHGVTGTPGFIVNGEHKRIFEFEDVAKALDEALAAAG